MGFGARLSQQGANLVLRLSTPQSQNARTRDWMIEVVGARGSAHQGSGCSNDEC